MLWKDSSQKGNSILINLPTSTITPLQCVQNTAVRQCMSCTWFESHHASSEETSLATCLTPYHPQNHHSDAVYTPPALSDISLRSSTFCQN